MFDYLDAYCKGCIYHAKSTRSCDFFIIEDRLRGCPGGDGCRERRTKKDVRKAMQTKWDTALGKELWEKGHSDRKIAEYFGIATSTVAYQRKKWETDSKRTPPEDELDLTVCSVETQKEPREDMKGEGTPFAERLPAAEPLDLYAVLEASTAQLQGIQAICTAEAISQLWNWSSKENLLKARAAIDHLLRRMEQ